MLDLVLTNKAQLSLEEIVDYYLINHSIERATKVLNSIDEAFGIVVKNPNSFPLCFDISEPNENIRQIIWHNTFKIVYRISSNRIEVLEIFHGRRNPDELKSIK